VKRNGAGGGLHLSSGSESLASSSGAVLLLRTAVVSGLANYIAWRNRHVTDPRLRKVVERAATIKRRRLRDAVLA
jgi:hypothetical protein